MTLRLKIATWNVNSIRSRVVNLLDWIKLSNPDIIFLQELKCTNEQFPYFEFELLGYNIEVLGQKAYNGVAIMSKYTMKDKITMLPVYSIEKNDNGEARYLEATIVVNNVSIRIASVYVPNGKEGKLEENQKLDETEKFYYKLRFYERLRERFREAIKNDEKIIMGGDFNTCPELTDMYSIKKDGDICCHKAERSKLREILNLGVCDTTRKFKADADIFSWWRYRPFGWEKNEGLRLDLILVSPNLIDIVVSGDIESKETRGLDKPSDHAPVVCEIDI